MAYLGAGITRFNTADGLTVTGDAQIDTNTLVVDSTNNQVGIGTSTHFDSNTKLTVAGRINTSNGTATGSINFGGGTVVNVGSLSNHNLQLMTNNTTRATIDSSGNFGIGTTTVNRKLETSANNNGGAKANYIRITDTDTTATAANQQGGIEFYASDSSSGAGVTASIEVVYAGSGGGGEITFNTAANSGAGVSEALRIDEAGKVLINKTTDSIAIAGTAISSTLGVRAAVDGNIGLLINRLSSDGNLVDFRKDSSTVGAISSRGGVATNVILRTATGQGAGIGGANSGVLPCDEDGLQDNEINLGASGTRWKDLYLSGGAYLGGTGSANKLEDYEEGTWTPTLPSGGSLSVGKARYVKIGNYVNLSFYVTSINPTAGNSVFKIGGLPFDVKTDSSYYVGGTIGYTGDNNLNDVMILTGTTLDYLYFHLNDGDGGAVTNTEMRDRGLTGASLDAMIASVSYTSA
tara:strand:+ start:801 stop:2192 length:1392 start_codon:yes stop_codon:yes gene_type:complete